MVLKKSPGGSAFPYYYKNGELFGMHLGSFGKDEAGVIARMKGEKAFLLEQGRHLPAWLDLYQTDLTDHVMAQLVEMLEHIAPLVSKLSLVGCSWLKQRKITRLVRQNERLSGIPLKYFQDPEAAKTWLVSEGG
jgi:hypothetical protein